MKGWLAAGFVAASALVTTACVRAEDRGGAKAKGAGARSHQGATKAPTPVPLPTPPTGPPGIRLVVEAEDFTVERGPWAVVPYGKNYFASTFAISFLSRMACLGAPAQTQGAELAVASSKIHVPEAGRYRAFARYEQPFGFSAEFTLEVEQGGRSVFKRTYGRLEDEKIWGFREPRRLPMQRFWWGGTDNIVWQEAGPIDLDRGDAQLRITAAPQMDGQRPRAQAAERHVDVIVLTNDEAGIEKQKKATYLEMDGWLVQEGDLFARFTNPRDGRGPVVPVVEGFDRGQHSPYYMHVRDWPTTRVFKSGRLTAAPFVMAGPRSESVDPRALAPVLDPGEFPSIPDSEYLEPGETSGWVPLGNVLDALNDSEWVPKAIYKGATRKDKDKSLDLEIEFAVPDGKRGLKPVRKLRVVGTPNYLSPVTFEIPGNVRSRSTVRTQLEAVEWLNAEVARFPKRGSTPKRFPIFGLLGFSGGIQDAGPLGAEARKLALALGDGLASIAKPEIAMHWRMGQVEKGYAEAEKRGRLETIGIVSYGDEIKIQPAKTTPGSEPGLAAEFVQWLRSRSVADASGAQQTDDPADPWYYYSRLFGFDRKVAAYQETTGWIESKLGTEVRTGINYSPHANYMVDELHFVRPFKQGALTLPWSEDYVWQVPEFSQQVMGYLVSGLRAGARYRDLPILMYVMPHSPGNIPRDFRLSFYEAIAHGARKIHYFCASPLAIANTENYIATDDLAMWRAVHDTTYDTGAFEDYVLDGRVRPARVGLLLSSVDEIRTGDSNNQGGIHNQERKAIYYALRHQQVAVDFVTEDDVLEGRGKDLDLIYVTQQFLHSRAVGALAKWVEAGGTLVALAGGGFLDEFGRDNPASHALYGVKDQSLWKDPALPMVLAKQDLPPYKPVDQASWGGITAPVLVWKQTIASADARVLGTYADGKPAVVEKAHGKGRAVLFGFFPGMAYLKSGLPLRPVDRSSSAEGFNHFLPTGMDKALRAAITDAFLPPGFVRPVETSEPLVEATLIETKAPGRVAVPLMNFTGAPLRSVTVRLRGIGTPRSVRSVERGALKSAAVSGAVEITLPLDVADMLLVDLQ
jgi:hypothetical protein